ncbi:S49 family peptidase [Thioflexithrix psekupsensis]|uniref:Peptidase S49 domain-containing protein n=1 Tax=Thioflexithrix psekupsensis TaxID=1570016 RepID=A0A251X7D1_9GAMM|nr:S49 family peptidase [Thioflexithrix psekupsensis]OUD13840.1 hypothetical protein TPSD3_05695 [Thioflexithrix psekupsensis]
MNSWLNSVWLLPLRIFIKVLLVMVSLLIIFTLIGMMAGGNPHFAKTSTDPLELEYQYVTGAAESKNYLLQINIDGVILGIVPEGLPTAPGLMGFSVTYGYAVREQLVKAAEQDEIKGVLLRLQTPGGTIFGSRAIFDGIKYYQEKTNKPVFAYVEGLSASGGMMAMVGADKIYADHGSMVGSIGVLGPSLFYFNKPTAFDGGLLAGGIVTEGGIEQTLVSAGRYKDLGNPFRRITAEELAHLQASIDEEYNYFVEHVAVARDILPDVLRNELGAQILGNAQAEQYHLIDGTLSYHDTLDQLAQQVGLEKSDYRVVTPHTEPVGLLGQLLRIKSMFSTHTTPQQVTQHLCDMVQLPLAYYGDPRGLCR